jgi:hypothetical protein
MDLDVVATNIRRAQAFLHRVRRFAPADWAQVPMPDVHQDPYASTIVAVQDAIRLTGKGPAERLQDFARDADSQVGAMGLTEDQATLSQYAVRALLVGNLPNIEMVFATLYGPFEQVIPFGSLRG